MHIAAKVREFAAVIEADRTRTDNRDAKLWKDVPRSHSYPTGRCSAWKLRVIRRAPLLKVT
jgi:hypothetical protein